MDELPRVSGQCRICLADESAPSLINPCACMASVHPACLVRWQQAQRSDGERCEVCLAAWAVPLPPEQRPSWVRSVTTNPRYPQADAAALPPPLRAALSARLVVGAIIAQSPARAAESAAALPTPGGPRLSMVQALMAIRGMQQ